MSERQPTKKQLELVAGVMGWKPLPGDDECTRCGESVLFENDENYVICLACQFDPLHDHNDLARLVEAMQAAGYRVKRTHLEDGTTHAEVFRKIKKGALLVTRVASVEHTADPEATFWAIVEALEEKEKQDG